MNSASDGTARASGRISVLEVRRRLLSHYDHNRRELPWRGEDDAYRIWVSEVMLQQTRVETVIPYYRRWLERFPDVRALADAEVDDVLGVWEGLGYYSRARNLHRAARVVLDRHDGVVPSGQAALSALPGVGRYTAGALTSIAFGQVAAAVDGNVRRVLCRLYDLPSPTPAELEGRAGRLVDPERPGDFNQALMDLGATVCTPRSPGCAACPLRSLCRAHARGSVLRRPRPRARKVLPIRRLIIAVIVDPRGRVLLVRRPEQGLLAGLWAFPEAKADLDCGSDGGDPQRAEAVATGLGFTPLTVGPALDPVPHVFTHLRALYLPFLVRLGALAPDGGPDQRWVDLTGSTGLALPVAQRKIARAAARLLGC